MKLYELGRLSSGAAAQLAGERRRPRADRRQVPAPRNPVAARRRSRPTCGREAYSYRRAEVRDFGAGHRAPITEAFARASAASTRRGVFLSARRPTAAPSAAKAEDAAIPSVARVSKSQPATDG